MKNVVDLPDRNTVEEEAAEWLIKLDGDTPLTPIDLEKLRAWMSISLLHREELHDLAQFWDKMNVLTQLAVPLEKVKPKARLRFGDIFGFPRFGLLSLGIAAVIVAGVAVITLITSTNPDPKVSTNGYYATAVGQQDSIVLVDNSEIFLNTNTQIEVNFGAVYRNIRLLQGEAHFTIAKNSEKPFRVYAGNGRIEAVGTAFSVRMNDEGVDVTVTEGRVALDALFDGSGQHGWQNAGTSSNAQRAVGTTKGNDPSGRTRSIGTLAAGQVGIIFRQPGPDSDHLGASRTITDIELSKRLSWRDGLITFSGEPLAEAVKEISRYTTVRIEFSDPELGNIRIGGRFPVGQTDAMFDALAENFGLHVTHVNNDTVILSSATDSNL